MQLNFLKKIFLQNSSIKLLGICLGHQMILKALGYTIKKSQNPLHGISIQLPLNTWWKKYFSTHQDFLEVQRYNSLAVTANTYKKVSKNFLLVDNEIMLFAMEKILSMQFHPESIGTIHKEIIFRRINHFFKS